MTNALEILHPGDAETAAKPEKAKPAGTGLVQPLLDFLARIFPRLSPRVQNAIGLSITGVLVIYILHGFIAPTYVRGQLWVKKTADSDKVHAVGWKVRTSDWDTNTNQNGWWMLPLSRGGIPGIVRIEMEDPAGQKLDSYVRYGPWPMWSAVFPMEYVLEFDLYQPQGRRIKKFQETATADFGGLLRRFNWVRTAYAQGPQHPSTLKLAAGAVPAARVPEEKSEAAYVIEIRSVRIEDFPSFFRSSGRVYFTVHVGDKALTDTELLYGSRSPAIAVTPLWVPYPESPDGPHQVQFPIKSSKESWIPVRAGQSERYGGLTANLTGAVNVYPLPSKEWKVEPKGKILVQMWADNHELLGTFDITDAVTKANTLVTSESIGAGKKATIEFMPMPGKLVHAAPYLMESQHTAKMK